MTTAANSRRTRALRLGFVPLNDCAPIVVAHARGLFAARGLNVSLHRELGWATVRDKIIYRELDAAHALAAMPFAATLGLGSIRAECLTGIVLNLHGNAITLSERLWKRGVRDGATLREEIRRTRHERILTFGVVNRFSSHHHLLREWFRTHGILESEVRVVVLPPSQMETNLSGGNLDGFCVGEPWNSAAVSAGCGWVAAVSAEIDPGHPEKVLMVRADFAGRHAAEHLALISALHEACAFCDEPENAAEISALLARPEYVGAPAEVIRRGLDGTFSFGHGKSAPMPGLCIFHRDGANEPSLARAMRAVGLIRGTGACAEPSALNSSLARRVFCPDLFEQAIGNDSAHETVYEKEPQFTAA